MTKFVRLIDQKRCMGCRSCVAACAVENHFTPDAPWNVMVEYEVGTYPAVKRVYNTMNCMHCEQPSCKAACDAVGAKAISKNAIRRRARRLRQVHRLRLLRRGVSVRRAAVEQRA